MRKRDDPTAEPFQQEYANQKLQLRWIGQLGIKKPKTELFHEQHDVTTYCTYRLYNRHYRISLVDDASMTQETGQATSSYHTISFGLVGK